MSLTRTNWPDVDDVVALNAETEVLGHLDHPLPMTASSVLAEEMPRLMAHNRRADRLGSWVARDRGTGSFLGWFMIRPIDEPVRTVELTYRLRRRALGLGYDVEGILGMIELARAAHVSTAIATMAAVDVAARRLMEMAGLRPVPRSAPAAAAGGNQVVYALDLTTTEARVPVASSR